MKKRILPFFLLFATIFSTFCQDKKAFEYAFKIDTFNIKNTISELAADKNLYNSYEITQTKISQRIAGYLKKNNIKDINKNSYFQDVMAYRMQNAQKKFIVNNYDYFNDYTYGNDIFQETTIAANEVVFAGYGIYSASYNDFENINTTNKIVMMLEGGSPNNRYGIPYTKDKQNSFSRDYLSANKPQAILLVRDGYSPFQQYSTDRFISREENLLGKPAIPEITINELLANKIIASSNKSIKQIQYEIEEKGQPISFKVKASISANANYAYSKANINNVIGIIEGRDLKNEYIVLCTHYDEKSADLSGIASALEISRLLALAQKQGNGPRRSVIILFTAIKENGLNGSLFYTKNPLFPLEKTVACINLDVLNGISPEYTKNEDYVYLVNHQTKSEKLMETINKINENSTFLQLDKKYNNENDYFKEFDTYNFSNKNIPSIAFTTTAYPMYKENNISANNRHLLKRTELIFLTVWELANQ